MSPIRILSDRRLRRRLALGVPVVLGVALVVALVGLSLSGAGAESGKVQAGSGAAVAAELNGIRKAGNVLGSPDAPVSVTEYVDLRCSVCASWSARELPLVLAAQVHPGRIRFERRVWPILGPDSLRAAEGAAAAAHQGGLMAFSEVWFRNQGSEADDYADDVFMADVAREAGLDADRFLADLDAVRSGAADPDDGIAATQAAATELGLTGTPAFVVTGPEGQEVIRQYAGIDELGAAVAKVSGR